MSDILERLKLARTATGCYQSMGCKFEQLIDDAADEIGRLRTELSKLRKQQAEAIANSATVCNVFNAFGERYDDSLSPADNVRSLIERQAASLTTPTPNVSCVPEGLLKAVNSLLHQIDIGDFVDSDGHSAKMLKPVHDLMALLAAAPSPTGLDNPEAPKS